MGFGLSNLLTYSIIATKMFLDAGRSLDNLLS